MFYSYYSSPYLYHSGIKGMKWGLRRYQNPDGSLTPAGRIRYGVTSDGQIYKRKHKERRKMQKAYDKKQAQLKKARDAANKKRKYEKGKEDAIKSGDPYKLRAYYDNLSQQERKEANEIISTKQAYLKLLNDQDSINKGRRKVARLMDTAKDVAGYAETATKLYNTYANVNNAFNPDKKLPNIGDSANKKKSGN